MSTPVSLPALGESVTEGTISRWLKEVGDTVEADEALVEVSTDKVDTEVPSPVAGVVLEIKVAEDEVAQVGAVLAVIGDPSEAGSDAPAASPQDTSDAPDDAAPAEEVAEDAEPQAAAPQAAPAAQPAPAGAAEGTEVKLPALGESVTEGTISHWLKEVGDTVEADEALVEVSTDKVDTEVPSPVAGTVLEIRVSEDEVAQVGAVLAVIGDASAQPKQAPAADKAEAHAPAAPAPQAPVPATPAPQAPAPATPAPQAPAAKPEAPAAEAPAAKPSSASVPEGVYVTPLVRKLAAEKGVDLAALAGSGVGGRIRKEDVLAAAEAAAQPAPAAEEAPAQAPAAQAPAPQPAAPAVKTPAPSADALAKRGTTEKASRLRMVIAQRMTDSLHTLAQLTTTVEVDMTAITRLRAKAKDDFKAREGVSLSYLPFIVKAATEALKVYPFINATFDMEAGTITYPASENVGIAVDTDRGLLVPVIKDAGDLNVTGLAKKIGDLAKRTRDNKVTPDELSGGTFTITNYGSAGALWDTPIINKPESAIMGTGALVKRPAVIAGPDGEDVIAIRDLMLLNLTYNHQLIDGAKAAQFLSHVKARLEAGDFGAEFGV